MQNAEPHSKEDLMTGSVESLDASGQVIVAKAISDELVAAVDSRGSMTVTQAIDIVAEKMQIGESEVGYGVAFARLTGALKLDPLTYTLSAI